MSAQKRSLNRTRRYVCVRHKGGGRGVEKGGGRRGAGGGGGLTMGSGRELKQSWMVLPPDTFTPVAVVIAV